MRQEAIDKIKYALTIARETEILDDIKKLSEDMEEVCQLAVMGWKQQDPSTKNAILSAINAMVSVMQSKTDDVHLVAQSLIKNISEAAKESRKTGRAPTEEELRDIFRETHCGGSEEVTN
ncbi:MAG: hypothetical protein IJ899_08735 [Blautia sp.]|nr:hypothetical protein [Blautia sp.]